MIIYLISFLLKKDILTVILAIQNILIYHYLFFALAIGQTVITSHRNWPKYVEILDSPNVKPSSPMGRILNDKKLSS